MNYTSILLFMLKTAYFLIQVSKNNNEAHEILFNHMRYFGQ